MKISLDGTKCAGHARCYAVDSELFPIDDSGYSTLQTHDVAAADEALVREGAEACPERALIMEEH